MFLLKFTFELRFDVLELLTGETNICEMMYSIVWQENQIVDQILLFGQLFGCNIGF